MTLDEQPKKKKVGGWEGNEECRWVCATGLRVYFCLGLLVCLVSVSFFSPLVLLSVSFLLLAKTAAGSAGVG
ncbi:hypothetical protein TRSC58_07714 [Trypanosoma rangeli SC58]|uniref:Transmembrane protein n=1 Tax=Trypanosoma rangeli SC58 TaxID=429131 RepID=A0A061IRH8_TRYRA|nr:hypothetical protein TRSC58_07714 [Trypanosoma rangeli SC58]